MNTSDSRLLQDDLKSQVMKSLIWLGGTKYIGQIISWAITILIIRILNPVDYGLMAMASVCTNFLVMLSELGLGAAIIQKKELEESQLSQIFGFIILSHSFLSVVLFFSSSIIAGYFSEPRLIPILQVLSVNFLLLSLYVIPQSILMRDMDFKVKSIVDLIATVIGVFFTLFMALYGYAVWSLVWGTVLMHLVRLIGYNAFVHTFFLPKFGLKGIHEFISFGAYTMVSRILWYFYSKADIFIGGRILGNELIGIYSVSLEFSQIPLDKFMPIINQVAFPAYSRIQSDLKLVGSHFLKTIRVGSLLIFPTFWGLTVIAPELLGLLLGNKWSGVILPVQLMCIIMPFRTLGTLISPMLYGIGRVDISFLYVAVASVLMPLFFLGGAYYGVNGLCFSWIFGYTLIFFISLKPSLRVLNLHVSDFLSDISVAFFASLAMVCAISGIKYLLHPIFSSLSMICIITIIGIIFYCFFTFLIKKESLYEMWSLMPGNKRVEAFVKNIFAGKRV